MTQAPKVQPGFQDAHRAEVARLFWEAFEGKLGFAMGPRHKALAFIEPNLQRAFAFSALDAGGNLLGVAGIKTAKGGLLTGDLPELSAVYGWWGGLWRGLVLEQFERPLNEDTLLMDGIFVRAEARGTGVGSALLKSVLWTAEMNGYSAVRLDVIDTNTRARALYERWGFEPAGKITTGAFAPIFGFRSATTMFRKV